MALSWRWNLYLLKTNNPTTKYSESDQTNL
jgi:hypothetical protein